MYNDFHDPCMCILYIVAAESDYVPSSLAIGVGVGGVLLLTIILITIVLLVAVVLVVAVKRRTILQHAATDGNCKHCAL